MSLKSYTGTPAAPNVTYCYDGQIAASQDGVCTAPSTAIPNSRGRLTQMRSSASTTTHGSYDGLGRVTQSSQTTGTAPPYTFGDSTHPGYTYNAAGLLTSMRYPSGRTVATGYDSAGRPNTLGLDTNAAQYVSSVTYWPHGAISQLTFGTGGVQQTTTYDPQRLQPTSIAGSSSSSGALLTLGYGWCPASDCTKNNGNLASQTITVGSLVMTQSYGYDKLNRLASAVETAPSQPGWNQSYTYDAYGNRAVGGNWIPNGAKTPQSLNDYLDNTGASPPPNTNRWKAWTPTFTNGNVYDAAGNLQKVTNGNACTTLSPCPQYNYDAENRMVSATSLQNTPDTTYVYDGDGRRVQKVQSTATTTYVYDATGNLAAEYGTPTDHGTKYLLTDHLGSTRVLVASDGTSPKRYDYLPFGEEIQAGTDGRGPEYSAGVYPSPAGPQSLEFTGKERDAETGLDFFGARYMSSAQGRFSSPDRPFADQHASNPQSWNLYAYGRNNPLKLVDVNGFKVLQAVFQEAFQKMKSLADSGGGRFYLDFAGIQGFHLHQSLGPHSNFDKWHADHTDKTSEIIPNKGIIMGFLRGFFGIANRDQVDTGNAIVAAKPAGVSLAFDTYSSGVNAAGKVAAGIPPGQLDPSLVVAPNTGSPAAVQAIDQADLGTTEIYVSSSDAALGIALFGSMSTDSWKQYFGDRVHVTGQLSHNLDRYHAAASEDAARQCAAGNPAACGFH